MADDARLEFQFYVTLLSGRWQAPAAVLPEGPKTQETVTRGPEGPESGSNTRVRGPEGPEDEQSSFFVWALASATICFSQLSPKSRFSRLNLDTLIAAKTHKNFSRALYL